MSVWLPEPTHVSIHVYFFPPDKYFTCFISFHLHVEIHFGSDGQGPCHWPLVPRGLAFLLPQPNLNLWPESKVPLQAAAGRCRLWSPKSNTSSQSRLETQSWTESEQRQ